MPTLLYGEVEVERRTRRSVALTALVFVAAFAVWAGYQYLRGLEDDLRDGFELLHVYRADGLILPCTDGSSVLAEGRAIQSEEPVRYAPDRVIGSPEMLEAVLTGRVAAGPISNNGILTLDQWVEEGETVPLDGGYGRRIVCSPSP
jgi:hypothetical protein